MKEFELIDKIKNLSKKIINKNYIKKSIGDDCAVLPFSKKHDLLVSTDQIIEDTHFKLDWYNPSELVKKVLYSNISDINACGGFPFACLLSAGLSSKFSDNYLMQFIKSLNAETKKFEIDLIGGDTCSAKYNYFTITLFGIVEKNKAIFRSGAKSGDYVYITGEPGLSDAGLFLLLNNKTLDSQYKKFLVKKHLIPSIIQNKNELKNIFNDANSMIDLSDGLSSELNHIARESKKKIIIKKDLIPINKNLKLFCKDYNKNIYKIIFSGGEDYYLVFTSNKKILNKNIYCIGWVENGAGVFLFEKDKYTKIDRTGFEHQIN